jgi:hypothetical protein
LDALFQPWFFNRHRNFLLSSREPVYDCHCAHGRECAARQIFPLQLELQMKIIPYLGAAALLSGTVANAHASDWQSQPLVVTASNTAANNLLVYDTSGKLIQTVATEGKGGAGGNAGGIASAGSRIAVVNFGSQSVTIFERTQSGFRLRQVVPTSSGPLSVAFGHHHLYVLDTDVVESHPVFDSGVSPSADGVAPLVKADGSSAQVGVLDSQLIISEKSNAIETVNLNRAGAVAGAAALVQNIPSNVNAPFGLATRDNDAYVTIAHADEISLVRNDAILTITASGTQHAPCWLALDGPYLFSSNSPSMSVSRYVVYGQKIIQDEAVAATFNGSPTDIAYRSGFIAVIDGAGAVSHLSIFRVDGDGNLTLNGVSTISSAANGVAIIGDVE